MYKFLEDADTFFLDAHFSKGQIGGSAFTQSSGRRGASNGYQRKRDRVVAFILPYNDNAFFSNQAECFKAYPKET